MSEFVFVAQFLADLFLYSQEADMFRCFSREARPVIWFHVSHYYCHSIIQCLVTYIVCCFHLSHLTWHTEKFRYSYVYTTTWPTRRNGQWGSVKNATLRRKRLFQLSYYKLSIYMLLHSSDTWMWRIYLSVDSTACS